VLGRSFEEHNFFYFLFHQSDPLLVFLLRHMSAWGKETIGAQDVLRLKDSNMYKVKRTAVKAARDIFERAIFPLFCYTHPENKMHLVWNKSMEPPPPLPDHLVAKMTEEPPAQDSGFAMITFRLEMEYVLVSNALMGFTCKETSL
jgi:hypothetical protein